MSTQSAFEISQPISELDPIRKDDVLRVLKKDKAKLARDIEKVTTEIIPTKKYYYWIFQLTNIILGLKIVSCV